MGWIPELAFALVGVVVLAIVGFVASRKQRAVLLERYYPPVVSTAVTAILGSVSIALVGLVLEDWLPAPEVSAVWEGRFTTNWMRVVIAVESLILLVLAIVGRTTRERGTGTVYYLRIQPEGQADWHRGNMSATADRVMDFRSATASISYEGMTNGKSIDIRHQVEAVSRELERAANDDHPDSACKFAPNMTAPAALAVGFDWHAPSGAILFDVNDRIQPGEVVAFRQQAWIDLKSLFGYHPVLRSQRDFEYRLEPVHAYTSSALQGVLGRMISHENSMSGGTVNRVLLSIQLTPTRAPGNVGVPVDAHVIVGIRNREGQVVPSKVDEKNRFRPTVGVAGDQELDVGRVAAAAALEIRNVLCDYSDKVILLQLLAPKTVNMAIGWHLANLLPEEVAPPARWPWSRIVPLSSYRNINGAYEYFPTHVRWDQRSPKALLSGTREQSEPDS
ncbi:MAG: hypothetical protein QM662_01535 [Gordonia sp. (in: high G+C Gram-positive bacteria)]